MVTPLDWQGIIKQSPEVARTRPAGENPLSTQVQGVAHQAETTERTQRVRQEVRAEGTQAERKSRRDGRGRRRPAAPAPQAVSRAPTQKPETPGIAKGPPGPVGGHLDITVG